MDTRGPQTQAPRTALPHDTHRTSSVIWGVAVAVGALFAIGQIITLLAVAPAAIAYDNINRNAFVEFVNALGPFGFGAVLSVIDLGLFALFAWLGRRHWIGFVFLPPLMYLGIGTLILGMLLSDALLSLAG